MGVQDAQRGAHVAQQRVQELEDACSAAEERAGCLEAVLQLHGAKLAEVCIQQQARLLSLMHKQLYVGRRGALTIAPRLVCLHD